MQRVQVCSRDVCLQWLVSTVKVVRYSWWLQCRAMAVLQVLTGYTWHLNKGGDEKEQQKAALFVSMMKNSVLDSASGALGKPLQGAWSDSDFSEPSAHHCSAQPQSILFDGRIV